MSESVIYIIEGLYCKITNLKSMWFCSLCTTQTAIPQAATVEILIKLQYIPVCRPSKHPERPPPVPQNAPNKIQQRPHSSSWKCKQLLTIQLEETCPMNVKNNMNTMNTDIMKCILKKVKFWFWGILVL